MKLKTYTRFIISILLALQICTTDAQIFDKLFAGNFDNYGGDRQSGQGLRIGSRLRDMMNINIPFRDGTSVGTNVLSGLVRVDKGDRSGLSGDRPLSVKILGIPIFERGNRLPTSAGRADEEPKVEIDELPIDP